MEPLREKNILSGIRAISCPLTAFGIISALLILWRTWAPITALSAVFLFPIIVGLILGMIPITMEVYRHRIKTELIAGRLFGYTLTGKLRACAEATIFSVLATTILSAKALSISIRDFSVLSFFAIFCGIVFFAVSSQIQKQFHKPFAELYSLKLTTLLCSVLFIPFYVWFQYAFEIRPVELRDTEFLAAMSFGLSEMPFRRGNVVAEILSFIFAFDTAKIWMAMHFKQSKWPAILYCLDASLLGFVVCRCQLIFINLSQIIYGKYAHESR